MEQTLRDIAPYLTLGALVVDAVLAVLLAYLLVGMRRLRRSQQVILGSHGERDIVAHVEGLDGQVRNLRDAVEALDGRIDEQRRDLNRAFTHRALLRYDAFRESGGEQSTSLALLDRERSGVVISTITSRDDARLYVKEVRRGVPDRALSPEEVAAVEQAAPAEAAPGAAARADARGGAPQGDAPLGGAPQGGAPQGGAPQGDAPEGGAPQGGAP